jgi:hypothetical protein
MIMIPKSSISLAKGKLSLLIGLINVGMAIFGIMSSRTTSSGRLPNTNHQILNEALCSCQKDHFP